MSEQNVPPMDVFEFVFAVPLVIQHLMPVGEKRVAITKDAKAVDYLLKQFKGDEAKCLTAVKRISAYVALLRSPEYAAQFAGRNDTLADSRLVELAATFPLCEGQEFDAAAFLSKVVS